MKVPMFDEVVLSKDQSGPVLGVTNHQGQTIMQRSVTVDDIDRIILHLWLQRQKMIDAQKRR